MISSENSPLDLLQSHQNCKPLGCHLETKKKTTLIFHRGENFRNTEVINSYKLLNKSTCQKRQCCVSDLSV